MLAYDKCGHREVIVPYPNSEDEQAGKGADENQGVSGIEAAPRGGVSEMGAAPGESGSGIPTVESSEAVP
ncbi:hypothetical protein RJT34_19877 [Clitoria ternatea]|uniref:Uncharacterized protein n=1 Tax=Clitoria ternatea TaxID=43366 RepID=A0AAN9IRU9_CLITE